MIWVTRFVNKSEIETAILLVSLSMSFSSPRSNFDLFVLNFSVI